MKLVFQIAFGIIFGYVGVTFLNVFLTGFAMWLVR